MSDWIICRVCERAYVAGHICTGPLGTPIERAIRRLELGLPLERDESAAVLTLLKERRT